MMSYSEIVEALFSLQTRNRGKLHLEAMQNLCSALGNPQNTFKSIHIAGTNGKGSVSTLIASALQSFYTHSKIGLYTSPHLCTFRERIQINRQLIPEEAIVKILSKVLQTAEKEAIPASFFELTTATAFLFYAENSVQYAVIETGLGGRHDATNILSPVLSVITSISLEHTELLGNTLEDIAYEKAGVIKENTPIVIGPTVPYPVIAPIAKKVKAPIHRVGVTAQDYRLENQAVGAKALQLLGVPKYIDISTIPLLPCRFEKHHSQRNIPVIFDVAHNPAGMEKLAELIEEEYPGQKFHFVIALSKTKDLKSSLQWLLPRAKRWHAVSAQNGRSYSAEIVAQAFIDMGVSTECVKAYPSVAEGFHEALEASHSDHSGVVVCGSFFIMSEARKAFGLQDPTDPFDLNEKAMPKYKP